MCIRDSPNFHLAEPLAAKLRLAAERLLRHERVWARRARVDLIIHQVMELQVIHVAHGNAVLERFTAAPIVQDGLCLLYTSRCV